MPFDGNPATFVKPAGQKHDVFSLHGLVAWLGQQETQARYDFDNCRGACLLSQYLKASGAHYFGDGQYYDLCQALGRGNSSDGQAIASNEPWTYGAALSRARQLLATA